MKTITIRLNDWEYDELKHYSELIDTPMTKIIKRVMYDNFDLNLRLSYEISKKNEEQVKYMTFEEYINYVKRSYNYDL